MHRYVLILFITACISFITSHASGKESGKKFLLKSETCKELSSIQTDKLPQHWRKYVGFIKSCSLFKSDSQQISLISIWIQDYFNYKYPPDVAPAMEEFPMPVIVDQEYNLVGILPEYYPDDPPRELELYYTPKHVTPPDLYIKVYNPGAGGDYSYPVMIWNLKKKSYLK